MWSKPFERKTLKRGDESVVERLGGNPALGFATGAGFAAGLCWVALSFGINYLFAGHSLKLWLIDGGYHTLQFTLIGLILGLWH